MKFDQFTIVFLNVRANTPKLSQAEGDSLQDAHMAYLARIHDEGSLLAAGPVTGSRENPLRGICIFRGSVDEARTLMQQDPMFKAGRHSHEFHPWIVPAGTITFPKSRVPVSMLEAND